MPEGHVLHRIAREIDARYAGRVTSSSSPQGRFADSAARLDGLALAGAEALGKHLLVGFEGLEERVHVHLGLLGKFTFTDALEVPAVGAIRWRLETDADGAGGAQRAGEAEGTGDIALGDPSTMDLRGPNVCALITPDAVAALAARIGPDPLRADADPERAWTRIAYSSKPIGALLMDQAAFAGVGNIYRAEVLFRHGIDPMMPGRFLRRPEFDAIWADLVALMALGLRDGRIDTVRDAHLPEVTGRAPRVDRHGGEVYVYRRLGLPCHVCGTPVAMRELEGRNLFWCPTCQPGHRRRRPNAPPSTRRGVGGRP